MKFIEKAIAHSPTVVELYLIKAKILQFGGNRDAAVALTEFGRNLDLADRYLNALSAKYTLKVDDHDRAKEIMSSFGRDESKYGNWIDMQVMWYEDHLGRAHYRQENYRLALKNFSWIKYHVDEFHSDCLDFGYHSFMTGSYN